MNAPWAYIAHRDGYWFGVATPCASEMVAEWAKQGATIITAQTQEQYLAELAKLKPWKDRPCPK